MFVVAVIVFGTIFTRIFIRCLSRYHRTLWLTPNTRFRICFTWCEYNSHSTYSHIAHSSFSPRCFLRRVSLFIDTRPTEFHLKRSALCSPLRLTLPRLCTEQSYTCARHCHAHTIRRCCRYYRYLSIHFVWRWWADLVSACVLLILLFFFFFIQFQSEILNIYTL